ncbi:unnamed protein product, partial [Ixodes persulcatus]
DSFQDGGGPPAPRASTRGSQSALRRRPERTVRRRSRRPSRRECLSRAPRAYGHTRITFAGKRLPSPRQRHGPGVAGHPLAASAATVASVLPNEGTGVRRR